MSPVRRGGSTFQTSWSITPAAGAALRGPSQPLAPPSGTRAPAILSVRALKKPTPRHRRTFRTRQPRQLHTARPRHHGGEMVRADPFMHARFVRTANSRFESFFSVASSCLSTLCPPCISTPAPLPASPWPHNSLADFTATEPAGKCTARFTPKRSDAQVCHVTQHAMWPYGRWPVIDRSSSATPTPNRPPSETDRPAVFTARSIRQGSFTDHAIQGSGPAANGYQSARYERAAAR